MDLKVIFPLHYKKNLLNIAIEKNGLWDYEEKCYWLVENNCCVLCNISAYSDVDYKQFTYAIREFSQELSPGIAQVTLTSCQGNLIYLSSHLLSTSFPVALLLAHLWQPTGQLALFKAQRQTSAWKSLRLLFFRLIALSPDKAHSSPSALCSNVPSEWSLLWPTF